MSTNSDQILLKAKDIEVGFPIIEGFVQAVRGVSFDIIQGKTLALVGESGSGKSVTARALMGMLSERAVVGKKASVEFAGQQLIGLPEEQLQKIRGSAISMIFQEPMTSLNPLYTVGNQIIESIQAHRKMPKKEARAEALRLLQEVQIPKPEARLDQYP
ncbi:MAG: ATP-binding cassette domain-containing protein, partial [bacterium]